MTTAPATAESPAGVDKRLLGALMLGHACADICQGAVTALLPFLVDAGGYGYGRVSILVLVMAVSSSVTQPVFGYVADRHSLSLLMPLGLVLSAAGISLVGILQSFGAVVAAVAVAGLGVAAFHPEAARCAGHVSGARPAGGISLFALGGNAGFALAPIMVTALVLTLGLAGTLVLVTPGLVAALVLAAQLPRMRQARRQARAAGAVPADAPSRWGAFIRLAVVVAGRSGVYFGLQAFVALWLIDHAGLSNGLGNAGLAIMTAGGAVGTLAGGYLGDRIGPRAVLLGSLAALAPLLILFVAAGPILALLLLAPIGVFCSGSFSTTIVLGQGYLPARMGLSSGVTVGAAIGAGGIIAAALGALADRAGLTAVMLVIALLPLPTLALARSLPRA